AGPVRLLVAAGGARHAAAQAAADQMDARVRQLGTDLGGEAFPLGARLAIADHSDHGAALFRILGRLPARWLIARGACVGWIADHAAKMRTAGTFAQRNGPAASRDRAVSS